MRQHGVAEAYAEPSGDQHWLCQDMDGNWYDIIVRAFEDGWREKSAYVPDGGTKQDILTRIFRQNGRGITPPEGPITLIAP